MNTRKHKLASAPWELKCKPLAAAVLLAIASPAFASSGLTELEPSSRTLLSANGSTAVTVESISDPLNHMSRTNTSSIWTSNGAVDIAGWAVSGISADGTAVTGISDDGHAYRWTSGGMINLGLASSASISADGKTIAGFADNRHAFRWSLDNPSMQDIGVLAGGTYSAANAVNANGQVVVGAADTNGQTHAFRWTATSGLMTDLGNLGVGGLSYASFVSADGAAVAGFWNSNTSGDHAFYWTMTSGMQDVGTLGGANSYAAGLSTDGSTVVGDSSLTGNFAYHAYRWNSGVITDLGTLAGGTRSSANAVNSDGRVIVGSSDINDGVRTVSAGFRWTQATGMQTIEEWLVRNGVAVSPTVSLTEDAQSVSADGNVVAGLLQNGHAYIARVESKIDTTIPPNTTIPPVGGQIDTTIPPNTTIPVVGGMIDTAEFNQTLSPSTPKLAMNDAEMIVNGSHGSPMRGLVPEGRYSVWGGGDYGRQDTQDRDAALASMEIGVATNIGHGVQFNMALGRSYSKADTANRGETTLRGTYVVPEVIVQVLDTPLYATATGLYSKSDANVDRGYLNAGTEVQSHGNTDVTTAGGRLRLDWLNAYTLGRTAFTPYTSVGYLQTKADGYTETGGGFPVRLNSRTERSTTAALGLDSVFALNAKVNLLGRIEGDHRFENRGAGSSGDVVGLYAFNLSGEETKQNWVRASIGAEAQLGQGTGSIVLNGTSEGDNPDYWVAVNYKWLL